LTARSLYWFDFETFGSDPQRDRPAQFAGIRTNENLEVIDKPLVEYCRPANDMLPQPAACLITGITPQLAYEKGQCEAKFMELIHKQLACPGTCGTGYNSIRFDDEVIRNCLYRNFFDPYAREWQKGNSRWDIIDMARLTRALRPEGIEWPDYDDGKPCFRLEEITKANCIKHKSAHDALSDVYATIDLAKLIRGRQPRLYDYVYNNRLKRHLSKHLIPGEWQPVLHVSGKYPAINGCIAVVIPLVTHPLNKNGVVVYDLSIDPSALIDLDVDEIRYRIFTPVSDLPDNIERIPLKTVHLNKCPILAPLKTMRDSDADRLGISLDVCFENLSKLRQSVSVTEKASKVFDSFPNKISDDPDLMIYSGGFFDDHDKRLMEKIRNTASDQLGDIKLTNHDPRLPELLFRYRARNYPETLNPEELEQWDRYRHSRITDINSSGSIDLSNYKKQLEGCRQNAGSDQRSQKILEDLYDWAEQLLI